MAMGCLGALFGLGWGDSGVTETPAMRAAREQDMSEGDIHSGPGGYEGMGYSGGYAAEYFGDGDLGEGEEA